MTSFALPQAKEEYDRETFQRLIDYIRELEAETYKHNQHVEIRGDEDSGLRRPELILYSDNGTRYAIRVDNTGVVDGTAI